MTELIQIAKRTTIDTHLEFEDYVAMFGLAREQVTGWQWAQAQVAAGVVSKYGEHTINRFAAEVELSHQYIRQLIKTWEVFGENSTQVEFWSFTHHKTAAVYAESAFEAEQALRQLAPNTSVKEFESQLLEASGKKREFRMIPADSQVQAVIDEIKSANPEMSDALAIREIALKHTGQLTCRIEASPKIKGEIAVISQYLADGSFENCIVYALEQTARHIQEREKETEKIMKKNYEF